MSQRWCWGDAARCLDLLRQHPADRRNLLLLARLPLAPHRLLQRLEGLAGGASVYRSLARLRESGLVAEWRIPLRHGSTPSLSFLTDLGIATVALDQGMRRLIWCISIACEAPICSDCCPDSRGTSPSTNCWESWPRRVRVVPIFSAGKNFGVGVRQWVAYIARSRWRFPPTRRWHGVTCRWTSCSCQTWAPFPCACSLLSSAGSRRYPHSTTTIFPPSSWPPPAPSALKSGVRRLRKQLGVVTCFPSRCA